MPWKSQRHFKKNLSRPKNTEESNEVATYQWTPSVPLTTLPITMTSILNATQDSADTIWHNLVQSALGWNMERHQI